MRFEPKGDINTPMLEIEEVIRTSDDGESEWRVTDIKGCIGCALVGSPACPGNRLRVEVVRASKDAKLEDLGRKAGFRYVMTEKDKNLWRPGLLYTFQCPLDKSQVQIRDQATDMATTEV